MIIQVMQPPACLYLLRISLTHIIIIVEYYHSLLTHINTHLTIKSVYGKCKCFDLFHGGLNVLVDL